MDTFLTVVAIIIIVLAVVLGLLYFLGSKAQKKQAAQQEMMEAMAQTVNMLIIDKKKMKISEAGLPKQVFESTPKYMRWVKMPIVKAKVGPRVMTFMCDAPVFEMIPVKQEVKATVSGLYITKVKGVRGAVLTPPPKKKFFDRFKKSSKSASNKSDAKASGKKGKKG